jgi:hypothetical protein
MAAMFIVNIAAICRLAPSYGFGAGCEIAAELLRVAPGGI